MTEFEKKLIAVLLHAGEVMERVERKLDLVLKVGIADLGVDLDDAKRDTAVRSLNLKAGTPLPIKPPTQRIVITEGIDAAQVGFATVPEETEDMKAVRSLTREPKVHRFVTKDMDPKDIPDQVQHLKLLTEYFVMRYCRVKHFSECVSGEPAERLKRLLATLGEL